MPETFDTAADLAARIAGLPGAGRKLIAVAGPPAAGKSTLAADLVSRLDAATLVPMDGFHLDNLILTRRGLLPRKGAPNTFDADGFVHAVRRLRSEDHVILPDFNRALDKSIAGAIEVRPEHRIVVVEGNYLCCTKAPWDQLMTLWDYTVFASAQREVLRARLIQRWLDHGLDEAAARERAEANDLPNAAFVLDTRAPTDAEM